MSIVGASLPGSVPGCDMTGDVVTAPCSRCGLPVAVLLHHQERAADNGVYLVTPRGIVRRTAGEESCQCDGAPHGPAIRELHCIHMRGPAVNHVLGLPPEPPLARLLRRHPRLGRGLPLMRRLWLLAMLDCGEVDDEELRLLRGATRASWPRLRRPTIEAIARGEL